MAVRIIGAYKTASILRAIAKRGKVAADQQTRRLANQVLSDARARAPIGEGDLKRSGHLTGSGSRMGVVFDSGHDAANEYGTSKMAAQPFIRPAVERAQAEGSRIERQLKQEIS